MTILSSNVSIVRQNATRYTLQTCVLFMIRQAQILINQFIKLPINQQVQMAAPMNYVLIPFEGNINPGYTQGLKLYLQATQEIYKEAEKFDISVLNTKDVIDNFLNPANKYGLGRLEFMVDTGAGENIIFRRVE